MDIKYCFEKWNATKSYIGEYEIDEVTLKKYKRGPGGIFNTDSFLARYDGCTLFTKALNGKIHGEYIKWVLSKKLMEFGVKNNGINVGPCFVKEDKEGYYTTYDENEKEDGFYIKFIENGYNFIIFYFNHGKLSSRCLINIHNELFYGECSSLNNYKKINSDKIILPFYPDFIFSPFSFNCDTFPKKVDYIATKKEYRNDYDIVKIGWHALDYSYNEVFGCYNLKNGFYLGELSQKNAFGYGIIKFKNGITHLGKFYEQKKNNMLIIENNKHALRQFNDDVLNGYSFVNQKDYFVISKYDNGKILDKLIYIEKETLNVSIHHSNGHKLASYPYPEIIKNKSVGSTVEKKKIIEEPKTIISSTETKKIYTNVEVKKKEEKIIKQGYHKFDYDDGYYEGKYSNDLRSGHGTFYFKNKDKVEGTWENDKMNGYGTYYFSNGDKYEGFFKDGLFNGRGTLIFKNGKIQTGYWENGKAKEILTRGREDYSNGYYEGEFLNDERHGIGTYYFNIGCKYEGKWEHNKFTGSGKFYSEDGTVYDGYFIDGKLNGHCEVSFINGSSYSGEFKDNKRHGYGIYFSNKGYKEYQYWENGERIE